ncbi:unnamed protein product [Hermetia illucens]|uniref:Kazal-like domain-containing protein n=1 Tax=Hermetia illucens TaxID=343691 RepID=A0A7R8UI46_HERIL|nr:unnamed protein product [Hermetia illucens]
MRFQILLLCFVAIVGYASAQRGCSNICPAVYQPVCARVGRTLRTFSNNCALSAYNCSNRPGAVFVRNGAC